MAELLKDRYFQPAFFDKLAKAIAQVYPSFDSKKFKQLLYTNQWQALELKARMRHAANCLHQTLPQDYPQAIEILSKVAPQFNDFDGMLFPDFVEVYGLNDWDTSIAALELFTQSSSSEFAIRPLIEKYPEKTMAQMLEWSTHPNHHVRRLASEGCRPRLPWASPLRQFKADPSPLLPLLENLKADPTDYVRRSVANNLNDIAKDHPEVVVKTAQNWFGYSQETNWIVKHACRTLLKQGNTDVLAVFGFGDASQIQITELKLAQTNIAIGDTLEFSFSLTTPLATKLRIEYGVDYRKANGTTSRKIFQISESEYTKDETRAFERKQSFRNMTTRKHHAGKHCLAIIVNGVEKAKIDFDLT